MESDGRLTGDGRPQADHVCVLVHGLWGNPSHMAYLASALREKHSEDKLHILIPKTNRDNNTYDGIDLGGERVTHEIEQYIEDLENGGAKIKKISVVGYSLGGLVARYAIGLLYARGWFDKITPVNFTTFAAPHLGTRAPVRGFRQTLYNILGSRTLSVSGRQLWATDTFRDTQRPLLSLLADPGSIFMIALSRFPHRVLYANCTNDRSAPYYTTSISTTDPFTNVDAIDVNCIPEYSPIILDRSDPVSIKRRDSQPSVLSRLAGSTQALLNEAPTFGILLFFVPSGTVLFLVNSGVQSVRSQQRIRLHEEGKAGIGLGSYRIPMMVENARSAIEGAIDNMKSQPRPGVLLESSSPQNGHVEKSNDQQDQIPGFPELALSREQFEMVEALDNLGFKKYRVYFRNVWHSHAAIIVRMPKKRFEQGKTVVRHWLDEEFLI